MKAKTEEYKKTMTSYPLNNLPIDLWNRVRAEARDVQKISMRIYIIEALREKLARDEAEHDKRG